MLCLSGFELYSRWVPCSWSCRILVIRHGLIINLQWVNQMIINPQNAKFMKYEEIITFKP